MAHGYTSDTLARRMAKHPTWKRLVHDGAPSGAIVLRTVADVVKSLLVAELGEQVCKDHPQLAIEIAFDAVNAYYTMVGGP